MSRTRRGPELPPNDGSPRAIDSARRRLQRPSVQRSRRAFLRAVGGSALALPFIRSLEFSAVHAQTGDLPMNFIGVYYPHGTSSPLFRRQASDTEDNFSITFNESRSGAQCVLSPFDDAATYGTSFKDRLLLVDGVDFVSGAAGHDAPRTALTGGGQNSTGASLDQHLAIAEGLGSDTVFSSLVLGVGTNSTDHTDNISYADGGAALPKVIDPSETFRMVFADLLAQSDPAGAAELEAKRARGQSVIDYLRADIGNLRERLGPTEATKLDQHLTSLRDLEKQLEQFEGSCQLPEQPQTFDKYKRYNGGEPNFDVITNLQVDMLAQAVACDLTRFATLWLADLSAGAINGTGIDHPDYNANVDVHNTIAHGYSIERGPGSSGDPQSWARLAVQNRYSYGKIARLLQRLEEFGALDSSLVLAVTDMGDTSNHSSTDVPIVMAGGANGRLRMGRYVSLQSNCPPDNYWCAEQEKVIKPVNQLLVSIAEAFGSSITSFGHPTNPAHAEGTLSELA